MSPFCAKYVTMLERMAKTLRERRRFLGLTQAELASRAHVPRPMISKLESDHFNELGIRKVARVCAALGLSLAAVAQTRPTLHELISESAEGDHG